MRADMLRSIFPILLLACLGFASSGRAQLTREYVEGLPVSLERLTLEVARGRVLVSHVGEGGAPGVEVRLTWFDQSLAKVEGDEARAAAERRAEQRAERMFERLRPRMDGGDDAWVVVVRDPHPVVFDFDPTLQVTVEVTVRVPEGARLEVRGVDTGVMIEQDYVGDLELRTDNGTYFVRSVSGGFKASTGGGSITVGAVGGSADVFSRSGAILAGRLHGEARLATSNGSIEVMQALDRLRLTGHDADLRLGLMAPMPKDVEVKTSAGRIVVTVDTDVATTIDASARVLGSVRMRNLPAVVRKGGTGRSSLVADVNGGGDVVRLRTRGGEIVLVGRAPMEG